MEDWTRVVLYGTYDGFVRSTNEPLQIAIRLDGGERVEIPSECVINADQIVKKDEIKLKDVIKRIKYFDLVTQAVWVNGILNELGSSFGLHKYHEGYKQGKFDGAMEREKVQVPQFVADWLNENDWREETLGKQSVFDVLGNLKNDSKNGYYENVKRWIDENGDLFARAWLDGYEVEEEKRYLVKMKGIDTNFNFLNRHRNENYWIFSSKDKNTLYQTQHTRKELEEADFGWVFDCPGIEIEEVE